MGIRVTTAVAGLGGDGDGRRKAQVLGGWTAALCGMLAAGVPLAWAALAQNALAQDVLRAGCAGCMVPTIFCSLLNCASCCSIRVRMAAASRSMASLADRAAARPEAGRSRPVSRNVRHLFDRRASLLILLSAALRCCRTGGRTRCCPGAGRRASVWLRFARRCLRWRAIRARPRESEPRCDPRRCAVGRPPRWRKREPLIGGLLQNPEGGGRDSGGDAHDQSGRVPFPYPRRRGCGTAPAKIQLPPPPLPQPLRESLPREPVP